MFNRSKPWSKAHAKRTGSVNAIFAVGDRTTSNFGSLFDAAVDYVARMGGGVVEILKGEYRLQGRRARTVGKSDIIDPDLLHRGRVATHRRACGTPSRSIRSDAAHRSSLFLSCMYDRFVGYRKIFLSQMLQKLRSGLTRNACVSLMAISWLGAAHAETEVKTVETRSVQLEPIEPGAIVIDGRLDEKIYAAGAWQKDFHQFRTLEPARPDTSFRVFTDGNSLYLAARLEEPSGKTVAVAEERDGPVWADDSLEFFIRANEDESAFLQIVVSARGVIADASYGQGGHNRHAYWNSSAQAGVGAGKTEWTLELAIPLAALQVNPKTSEWRIQVARNRQARGDEPTTISTWSPTPESLQSAASFGLLRLPDLDRSLLGWTIAPGEAAVVTGENGYLLQQPLLITNNTGKYRNVVLKSGLSKDKAAHGERTFGITDGKSIEVVASIPLGDRPAREDTARHELSLVQQPDRMLAFAASLIGVDYVPASLILISPGYRASIFATQGLKSIEAQLVRHDETQAIEEVSATLKLSEGSPRPAAVETIDANTRRITVAEADTLPEGKHTLAVDFKINGRPQTLERTITVLPHKPGEVWIDRHGVLYRDGEPLPVYGFIFGRWADYAKYRIPGMWMNVAVPVWGTPPFDTMRQTVESLGKLNIFAGVYILVSTPTGYDPLGRTPLSAREKEDFRALARAARDNPNILFYYLADEPEIRNIHPSRLREVYQLFAEEDPYRPVVVLNDTVSGVRDYQYGADISNPDPYPLFLSGGGAAKPLDLIGTFLDAISIGKESYRARWITPQGFNYGNYNAEGNRGPTALEMRSQQIIALMHGVVGITWYPEYMAWDEAGVFTSLPFLSREFKALYPLLVKARPERIPTSDNFMAGWSCQEKEILLMLANPHWRKQTVTLTNPKLTAISMWRKLGTTETIAGGTDTLTVELQPHEGIMLASPGVPYPSDLDWKEVEKAEVSAQKASVVPGNIAHFSRGTHAVGFKTKGPYLRPRMAIDGMKDPRSSGFEQPGFEPGMGIELLFTRDHRPKTGRLIGTNILRGTVEIFAGGKWHALQEFAGTGEEQPIVLGLPGDKTSRLRFTATELINSTLLRIREIEIYE